MNSCALLVCVFVALAAMFVVPAGSAQQPAAAERPADPPALSGRWNIPGKTLGGMQFWCDELVYSDWRIQRNFFSGHCRLLDGEDRRQAWGTLDECRQALEAMRQAQGLPPMRGRVVIVMHGLGGSRPMMNAMCRYLSEHGKLTAISIGYPSTRTDVDADAAALKQIVANLPEVERIDFVAHSLGNIVIRRYLALSTDPAKGVRPDPRIRRIVMLAPPNHGAQAATNLVSLDMSGEFIGPAARQLTAGWPQLEPHLVAPACEFAILAGGRGGEEGYNKLIPGDNDGLVTVASAKLAGARDFRVVPAMHFFFTRQPLVQKLTLQFLLDGHFETEAKRAPL